MNTETSNKYWEELAEDWDTRMGDDGNDFHRELIRPATLLYKYLFANIGV